MLVPLASGCGWLSVFSSGHATVTTHKNLLGPAIDAGPRVAGVPRWIKLERLPARPT